MTPLQTARQTVPTRVGRSVRAYYGEPIPFSYPRRLRMPTAGGTMRFDCDTPHPRGDLGGLGVQFTSASTPDTNRTDGTRRRRVIRFWTDRSPRTKGWVVLAAPAEQDRVFAVRAHAG